MSMIFPGMDPYLEDPELWMGVHNALIVYIRDQLRPGLHPRYVAAIEERVYVERPPRKIRPDVEILRARSRRPGARATATLEADAAVRIRVVREDLHEPYLNILDLKNDKRIVAVLEVLSPTNKYAGEGRDSYLAKQGQVLASDAHLVEIDLLRHGPYALAASEVEVQAVLPYDYIVSICPADDWARLEFDLYPRTLRQRLPRIAIPLADDDPPVVLDLQAAMERVHEEGSYLDRIDYSRPCIPRLSASDQAWADERIREAEERPAT